MTGHAFKDVEVAGMMVRLGGDRSRGLGVPYNNISIRTNGNATLQEWREL